MATLKQIQEKQKSVKSINKITKAMQLVSSAKSQKAIKAKNEYEDYFNRVQNIVSLIVDKDIDKTIRDKTYWIIYMSDLGLAGGYNSMLLKTINENWKQGDRALIIGKKGFVFENKYKDDVELFSIEEVINENKLFDVITRIKKAYYEDEMIIKTIHNSFISQMESKPKVSIILPIQPIENKTSSSVFEFEIGRKRLLHEVEDIYIQTFLIGIYKDAQASEHSSRRLAMETATKNGDELIEKLSIEFNRGRQAKITQEINEIIAGAESIN